MRGGLITLDDLLKIELVGSIIEVTRSRYPKVGSGRISHEVVRRLVDSMVTDLVHETRSRVAVFKPESSQEVRELGSPLIGFSKNMQRSHLILKQFLFDNVYRHPRVNRMSSKARRIVTDLFTFFNKEPDCLPIEWRNRTESPETPKTARVVGDYVAGMTDRYAMSEHAKLFNLSMENQ